MRQLIFTLSVLASVAAFGQPHDELNRLGLEAYRQGQYEVAAKTFTKGIALHCSQVSECNDACITSLSNLAYCQRAMGNYTRAQDNFRRALRCVRKVYGSSHISTIEATTDLGNAFLPAGLYDSAEYYFGIADDLLTQHVQSNSSEYQRDTFRFFDASVHIQGGLASLNFNKGKVAQACQLMEQQRNSIRAVYPDVFKNNPAYTATLNNLYTYYQTAGEFEKAKSTVLEQLSIIHDEDGLTFVNALNNLGGLYKHMDMPDSAVYTWNRALARMNTGHSGTDAHIGILNNLGELFYTLERYDDAIKALKEAVKIQKQRTSLNPRIYQTTLFNLAECYHWNDQIQEADKTYDELLELMTNETLHHFTYLTDSEKISFYRTNREVLDSYAIFALEASGSLPIHQHGAAYKSNTSLQRLFDIQLLTKGLILNPAFRVRNSIMNSPDTLLRRYYHEWQGDKQHFAALSHSGNTPVGELQKLNAKIEYAEKWLRSRSGDFRKGFVIDQKSWSDVQKQLKPGEAAVEMISLANGIIYAALILTPSTKSGPVVALVKSKPQMFLEKQFFRVYANSITYGMTDTTSYEVFWKPVASVIRANTADTQLKKIYFSPDGVYHKISLNSLYNHAAKRYLIDEVEVSVVTSTKEFLKREQGLHIDTRNALLVGRPDFGENGTTPFTDLPGTEKEVDEISRLMQQFKWSPLVLKRSDANESRLRGSSNVAIMHIATHGFSAEDHGTTDPVHALMNSGVALAQPTIRSDNDDGVLTAFEITNMNLDGVGLVTLSACDTGLGEFESGEGVYGLQKALRSAGVKFAIISLWKVDDGATQQLMVSFYQNWLSNTRDVRGAFRKAQLELKKKFSEPKYWAAFVVAE